MLRRWTQTLLPEAGEPASGSIPAAKSKGTFLGERYQRIRRRRGKQKALVAIARTIVEIAYRLIADPMLHFHDLGADYYDTLNPEKRTRSKSGNWNGSTPA